MDNNMSYVEYEKKNRKNGFIGFLIFLMFIGGSAYGGYYFGHKLGYDEGLKANNVTDSKEDSKDDNKEDPVVKEDANGINKIDLTNIDPYIIDNSLDLSNVSDNVRSKEVVNSLSKKSNLINDKGFKIALAFALGFKLDKSKYDVDVIYDNGEEVEATGGVAIKVDNFASIYKKIYGEELDINSVPNSTKFNVINNKIYGTLYTGYNSNVNFEIKESEINDGSVVAQMEQDFEEYDLNIGSIKIEYKENSNGTIFINGLYFISNQSN
ncbi:MAG: hypothetical protein ACI4WW_05845 [Candidatus Coprovivens sp.]